MAEFLCRAAEKGDVEEVRRLIDGGADVAAKGAHGETALHHAARNGRAGAVRMLRDAGANVAAKNGAGKTALDFAALGGHAVVARVLRDAEAAQAASAPAGVAEVPVAALSTHAGARAASIAQGGGDADRRTEKTLDLANTQKEKGNAEYKMRSYATAAEAYSKAIRLTEMLKPPLSEEQQAATRALKRTCLVHPPHLS